jgi:hypothetical protein
MLKFNFFSLTKFGVLSNIKGINAVQITKCLTIK